MNLEHRYYVIDALVVFGLQAIVCSLVYSLYVLYGCILDYTVQHKGA